MNQDVILILGGKERKIKKGHIITILSLQDSLESVGNLINPNDALVETIARTTDKFLQIVPLNSDVTRTNILRVTAEEAGRVISSTEKIPFPPQATTMFDVVDILKAERGGE